MATKKCDNSTVVCIAWHSTALKISIKEKSR